MLPAKSRTLSKITCLAFAGEFGDAQDKLGLQGLGLEISTKTAFGGSMLQDLDLLYSTRVESEMRKRSRFPDKQPVDWIPPYWSYLCAERSDAPKKQRSGEPKVGR